MIKVEEGCLKKLQKVGPPLSTIGSLSTCPVNVLFGPRKLAVIAIHGGSYSFRFDLGTLL